MSSTAPQRLEDFLYEDILDEPDSVTFNYVGVGQTENENETLVKEIGDRIDTAYEDVTVTYRPMALSDQQRSDVTVGDAFNPGTYIDLAEGEEQVLIVPQTAMFNSGGQHPAERYKEFADLLLDAPVSATIHPFVESDLERYPDEITADSVSTSLPYETYTVDWTDHEQMLVARAP